VLVRRTQLAGPQVHRGAVGAVGPVVVAGHVDALATVAGTVPVFLVGFITSEGLFWAQLAAAATIASVPITLIGWIAQRQLVRGLSMGALK
jgi:ABC-type glycerol-3-phosphate transport system permease component